MKLVTRIAQLAIVGTMALGLSSTAMASDKTTNTLLGAGLGAAAGAIFSEGDPLLTLGGAAAGGVLGNVLTDDRRYRSRSNWHERDHRSHRGNDYRRAGYHPDNGWHRGHYKNGKHHR